MVIILFTKILTKKLLCSFFILSLFLFNFNISFASTESSLSLNCRSCVVLDRTSKRVLFGKNEYNKVKMASTTKIMTATIIIENCDLNKTVTISKKAAETHGSRLGLKTNDKITIRDLLYGLLLVSGNDAAVALAESCSGSVSDFATLMNNKAEELGLVNTHFETPHGLDSDNHYTTAYELALITDYALNNSVFLNIVGTKNYTITINGYPKALTNTNELLGNLNGVYGVKTGFTNGANRCLVTSCKRDNMDIICVVLGCDTKNFRSSDSTKLINYVFDNFEYINIEDFVCENVNKWNEENINYFSIEKGISSNLRISSSKLDTPIIPIRKDEANSLNIDFSINKYLSAPIYKDTIIGKFTIYTSSKNILEGDIISLENIYKKDVFYYLKNFFKDYTIILGNCMKQIIL